MTLILECKALVALTIALIYPCPQQHRPRQCLCSSLALASIHQSNTISHRSHQPHAPYTSITLQQQAARRDCSLRVNIEQTRIAVFFDEEQQHAHSRHTALPTLAHTRSHTTVPTNRPPSITNGSPTHQQGTFANE